MAIDFTITIPNEPWITDTSEGKTIACSYIGPRYVLISIDSNNVVQTHEGYFSSADDYDPNNYADDKYTYHLVDANNPAHTAHIAFITNLYTNENHPNFEETLPDGSIYNYDYADEEGVMDQIFQRFSGFTYDPVTETFSDLQFVEMNITREDWLKSVQTNIDLANAVDRSIQTDEMNTAIDEFIAYFTNIETTFAGVSYWKIPFIAAPQWKE